jgi:hypothetical protein
VVDMLMYEWLDACAVWPWYEVSYLLKVGFHFLLQHSLSSRLLCVVVVLQFCRDLLYLNSSVFTAD